MSACRLSDRPSLLASLRFHFVSRHTPPAPNSLLGNVNEFLVADGYSFGPTGITGELSYSQACLLTHNSSEGAKRRRLT